MYHRIRITMVSLVAVVMCVLSSVGTLSYFTDTDGRENTFAVGNASTRLTIYNDANHLDDEHIFDEDDYVLTNGLSIPFYPQATNDGNIPVYQRFRVVIPIALRSVVTLDLPAMEDCTINTAEAISCSNDDYAVSYNPSVNMNDEPTYAEYYIVRKTVLGLEATTDVWPMTAIRLGDIASVRSQLECDNNDPNKCSLGIRVYSDVIQSAGFTEGAVKAFEGFSETYN